MTQTAPTVHQLEGMRRYIIEIAPDYRFVVESYMLRDSYVSSIGPAQVLEAVQGGKRFVIIHTEKQRGRAIVPMHLVEYVSYYEDGNFIVNYQSYLTLTDARQQARFCAAFGDPTKEIEIREVA